MTRRRLMREAMRKALNIGEKQPSSRMRTRPRKKTATKRPSPIKVVNQIVNRRVKMAT